MASLRPGRAPHDPEPPASLRRTLSRLTGSGFTRRYYVRVIQCRDGLTQLSPYLHLVTAGRLDPTALPTGDQLAAALVARQHGMDPARPVVTLIGPVSSEDIDTDAYVLAELSKRLMSTPPSRAGQA